MRRLLLALFAAHMAVAQTSAPIGGTVPEPESGVYAEVEVGGGFGSSLGVIAGGTTAIGWR